MTTPVGVLNHANSFLKAAEHLRQEIIAEHILLPFSDPVSLLFGHGIELTMKAFLQEKNAAGVWGHDLEALRTKVQAHGCPLSLDETEAGHFNLINNVFGKTPHEVRYLVTGFSSVHDDAIISKIAFRFALEVAQHIPGSVRRPTSGSRV